MDFVSSMVELDEAENNSTIDLVLQFPFGINNGLYLSENKTDKDPRRLFAKKKGETP